MTTPNHDESKQLNEPKLLEAEGFLNRGWRRLGEALGPFVAERTGNEWFRGTRDIHAILNEMNRSWNTHFRTMGRDERDQGPKSWVNDLLSFRNGPWAHLIGYDDHDVLKCLYQMCQLLRAIAADKQAQVVEQMYDELGRLLFRDTEPTPGREDNELTEPQQFIDMLPQMSVQQFFQLQAGISQILAQLEGGGLSPVPSLTVTNSASQVAPVTGPAVNEDMKGDGGSINPTAADFLRMGNEDREAGFIEEAVTKYSRAIELEPDLVWAYFGRGQAYMDREDYESAISDFSSASRFNQGEVVALVHRGLAYASQGRYAEAISDYSDALRLAPGGDLAIGAYCNRGNAYKDQHEYDSAVADYSAALHLDPDDEIAAAIYFNRGRVYSDSDDHDQAIADFSKAIEIEPDVADYYEARGLSYFAKGEYKLVIAEYDAVLRLEPENGLVYSFRGYAYFTDGEYDLAIADYSTALDLDLNIPFAYAIRGLSWDFNGQQHRAIDDYESALALEPDDELADLVREWARLSQNTLERATRLEEEAKHDQLIADNPRDPQGWHFRGLYSFDEGNFTEAIEYLTIAIKLAQDNAEVWNDRGLAHWQQEDDDLAYEDYGQAIILRPDFANAYYNRAWVWRRRGEHRNAIIDFSQALALKPDYAAAYQHRGISYLDIGERKNAQADFEMARLMGFKP